MCRALQKLIFSCLICTFAFTFTRFEYFYRLDDDRVEGRLGKSQFSWCHVSESVYPNYFFLFYFFLADVIKLNLPLSYAIRWIFIEIIKLRGLPKIRNPREKNPYRTPNDSEGPVSEKPINPNPGLKLCSVFFFIFPSYVLLRVSFGWIITVSE